MFYLIVLGHSGGTTLKRSESVESLLSPIKRTSESGDGRQSRADSRAKRSISMKKVENPSVGPTAKTYPGYPGPPPAKSRMWNESFRVAIDRSYDDQVLPQESQGMNSIGSQGRGQGPPLGQESHVQGFSNRPVSRNPPPYQ